jgi:hypothetical protein
MGMAFSMLATLTDDWVATNTGRTRRARLVNSVCHCDVQWELKREVDMRASEDVERSTGEPNGVVGIKDGEDDRGTRGVAVVHAARSLDSAA